MKKLLAVVGTVAAFYLPASALGPLPVTTDLLARFDASDATSMTLSEHNEVLEWRSQVGSLKLTAPAPMKDAKYNYCNGIPFLTTEHNLKAVFFGETWDGISTNSLMSAAILNVKTVVAVTRQHSTSEMIGGLFGQVITSAPRLKRDANCAWDATNYTDGWINGVKGECSFADCGGTNAPHVVAVTFASNSKAIEIIGAAYNARSSGASGNVAASYDPASIHELLFYTRVLSDEELQQVQQYLMEKWCIGGLYVWTGDKDSNWDDGENWACGHKPGDDAKTIRLDGSTVVAQGALTLPATALIDLGGGSLTVAGLTGGTVTNSAQTVATLTVNATTDAELDATVSGNVNLVKNGSGVLKVVSGQTYAGTTTLNGGTLQAVQPSSFDWNKYSGMVFRLDASEVGTVETETGASNVTKWASLTDNGYSFRPLKDVADFADKYDYAKGESLLTTDADGRPCVRFGSQVDDATSLGSPLCPFDENDAYKSLTVATVFFVNRQHVTMLTSGRQCGLFGQAGPSSDRVYRTAGDCVWTGSRLYTVWTSGKKQHDLADPQLEGDIEFASSSGTAGPHVLSVVRSSKEDATGVPQARTLNIIGAAYMDKEDTTAKSRCGQFDLYEAIGFSSVLTEDEIKEITDHLIAKWGVKTREDVVVDRPANTLSTNTSYVVTAPTVLDLGWMNQDFGNLSFATESASYPLLTFARTLSSVCIDGKTLTLTHPADVTVKKSDILCGNAGISGEFAAVEGGKVWYAGEEKERTVRAGDEQGIVILLK